MITEQELLDFMLEQAYKPLTYQELEAHFQIADAGQFRALLKLLNELEQAGRIVRTKSDRYGVPERMDLIRGRLQANAKGFGFLIPENRDQVDIYIHANDLKGAMNNDTLLVRVTSKAQGGARLEGEVVRIITRANTRIVGTFQDNGSYGFVIPDDKRLSRDIFIPQGKFMGAVDGTKVVATIVHYPESGRAAAEGEIIEVLGHKDDPGVDILSIIRKHALPEQFPDEVEAEANRVNDTVQPSDLLGRRDLREQMIVTIDGEDAKDLDDAVNVERLENGNYKLGVHIADVGYYVKEGSALDREAFNRGCSVYLVDRVIPMLPHRLSNGICSLNPQVDRLTLSCEMEINPQGQVVRHDIFPSVIKTTERMTYTNVRKILVDQDPDLLVRYEKLIPMFQLMEELAEKLRKKRFARGSVDFDLDEAKVIVDEEGKAVDIIKRERSVAEKLIEEFMLAANETVAEHFFWLKVPFLYRIHENPDQEKLGRFMEFVANFGYVVRGGKTNVIHPRALQTLLEQIHGTPEQTVIGTMMLRSMKQAKYDASNLGHFGLAAEFYTHFTSPIRRYPDLVIHRVIREVILANNTLSTEREEYLNEQMPVIAKQSSERERVAVDAERDTDALKKAEFMLDKVGDEFDAIISSVTSFGMFVELPNTVEGMIRLSALTDDYYHFHERQMALIGERTSKIYRLGDTVKVKLVRVNMLEHTLDFEMLDQNGKAVKKSRFDEIKASLHGARATDKSGNSKKHGRNGKNGKNKSNGAREDKGKRGIGFQGKTKTEHGSTNGNSSAKEQGFRSNGKSDSKTASGKSFSRKSKKKR